ncbi:glycosyltransferase, partial [bacterium]|nr:glycosyltransferase [bacterium]
MTLLIITHHRLISQWSGAISRIRRLAQELAAQGAQVTVLAFVSPKLKPLLPLELGNNCDYYEFSNWLQWGDGLMNRFGFPAYSFTSHLNQFLPLPLALRKTYDVVISESPFLWKIARRFPCRLKVLSSHNHELTYHNHFPKPFLLPIKWLEKKALQEADVVVTVSKTDQNIFRKMIPQKAITVIENGFDRHSGNSPAALSPFFSDLTKRTALFLASQSNHNLKALEALVLIFSASSVSKKWRLWVVGNIKPQFNLPTNIFMCGPQKELLPFFQNAEIALNPMVSGSGSNLKLIESLGNGCPVLTTPLGARGFPPGLMGLHIESLQNFQERLL